MTIGIYIGVCSLFLIVLWPKLIARPPDVTSIGVSPNADIQTSLEWPTSMYGAGAVNAQAPITSPSHTAAAATPASSSTPRASVFAPLREMGARIQDGFQATIARATRRGSTDANASMETAVRQEVPDTTAPAVEPIDPVADAPIADEQRHTDEADATPQPNGNQSSEVLDAPTKVDAEPDTVKGTPNPMYAWFKKLFRIRDDAPAEFPAPGLMAGVPDLLASAQSAAASKDDGISQTDAGGYTAAPDGKAYIPEPHVVPGAPAPQAEFDEEDDLGALPQPPPAPRTDLPSVESLLGVAFGTPAEDLTPAAIVKTMTGVAEDGANAVAKEELHIPPSLGIDDAEAAAFEAEEAQRKLEEDRIADEYSTAAADAELRAKLVKNETTEDEHDRAAAQWASEFVGDPQAYLDPDARARIVEDLPTFGDEGRTILERIVAEDPAFASRAKELLADVA